MTREREREEFEKWWNDSDDPPIEWHADGKPLDEELWDLWTAWETAWQAGERLGLEREREACAKDVEQLLKYHYDFCAHNYNTKEVAEHTAKQIRARGVAQEE